MSTRDVGHVILINSTECGGLSAIGYARGYKNAYALYEKLLLETKLSGRIDLEDYPSIGFPSSLNEHPLRREFPVNYVRLAVCIDDFDRIVWCYNNWTQRNTRKLAHRLIRFLMQFA